MSGPNSITYDFTGVTQRDVASSQPAMLRAASQEGSLENQEQQAEHLRTEINAIKANYRSKNGVWHFLKLAFSLCCFPTLLGISINFCNNIKYYVTKIGKISDT